MKKILMIGAGIGQIPLSKIIKQRGYYLIVVTIPGKYITIVQNSIVKEAKDKSAGISTKDVTSAIMQAD